MLPSRTTSPTDAFDCTVCGAPIEKDKDEYLKVDCNICGYSNYHRECGVDWLIAKAKDKSNSKAVTKYMVKARKQPIQIFEQHMPCPGGVAKLSGFEATPGGAAFRGKMDRVACPGFTRGAEWIKPMKEPAAPPPPILPPRGPAKKQRAATLPPAKPPSAKPPAAKKVQAADSASVPAPGAAAALRLLGERHSQWTTVGSGMKKAAGRKTGARGGDPKMESAFHGVPPLAHRPPELKMCMHYLESGDCRIFQCEYCHSEEELRNREKDWSLRQQAKKKEARRRELEAAEAALATQEHNNEVLAQVASLEHHERNHLAHTAPRTTPAAPWAPAARHPAVPLPLSHTALALIRSFKQASCLNSLLDMGFAADQAQAVTESTGADLEAAVQLLMDGQPGRGSKQVDISKEVEQLAAAAAELGISADAVEGQLVFMGRNVEAALETMREGSCTEEPRSLLASEPGTPSLGVTSLPHWAGDTSSALSDPTPGNQSPCLSAALGCSPTDVSHEPGVLSLADFSSSPAPEAYLEQTLLCSQASGTGAQAGVAAPTWPSSAFEFPNTARPSTPQPLPYFNVQQDNFPVPQPAALQANPPSTYVAVHQPHQLATPEEEIDELMTLMGIN